MKTFIAIIGLCGVVMGLEAQAPAVSQTVSELRTYEELDELLAPIALYPDALVALILPAATVSADIARASDYLSANGDPNQVGNQRWDESVKSLSHYPTIVTWMNDNISWTQEVGDAFLTQPADVMKSIQQLRARAIAAGTLFDTPEQDVISDGNEIRIVPARPEVIYVPYYNPEIVYERPPYPGSWIGFGPPFGVGAWMNFDLDWDHYGIWTGAWYPGWDFRHPAWRRAPGVRVTMVGQPWRAPPVRRPDRPGDRYRPRPPIVHPNLIAVAPTPTPARPTDPRPAERRSVPAQTPRPDPRGYPFSGSRPTTPIPPAETRPAPPQSGTPPAPQPAARPPTARPPTPPSTATRPVPPPTGTRPTVPSTTLRQATPPPNVFDGYNRGTDTRTASQRGQASREQTVAPAVRPTAPPPRSPPPRSPPPPQPPQPPAAPQPASPATTVPTTTTPTAPARNSSSTDDNTRRKDSRNP